MEAGWSARRVARQLGRSDCVVRKCWDQDDPRAIIYTKTRLRTPSTDQSSRRPPHRKKCTRTANCFIGRHPGTGSTFIRGPCVFSNHTNRTRYNLNSDDNRVRVWRPRGERLNPAFSSHRHIAPTAGVMVWGAIAYNTWSHP
ncbi:uncharacterized protein TNCV_3136651 [Trichonephila clavipes]|nr:uncharacterized protein TNCV_3136651 [Trichonephila clavipes]